MATFPSSVRTDISYLRRRVRPTASMPVAEPRSVAVTPASSGSGSGLSLSAPSVAAPPPAASTPPASSPAAGLSLSTPVAASVPQHAGSPRPPARPTAAGGFPAPSIAEVRELGAETPVLRLSALQSALGSLVVSGVTSIAWEDSTLITGAATLGGGTIGSPVRTNGNRPLVGFDEDDVLIALRHIRSLRRALFIGRGPGIVSAQLFTGDGFTLAPSTDSHLFVLSLLRVDNLVELRAEPVDRTASDEDIYRVFGFSMTPFLAQQQRNR